MKKKVLTATLIIMSSLIILLTYKKDNNVTFSDTSKNNNNILSIMLETSSGSGNYQESSSNLFPRNGYIFNENLSNCENGSKISWNEENKSVSVKSNKADKCYLYFDIYEPIEIKSYSIISSGKSIIVSLDVKKGTEEISNYYYSYDDGNTYIESNTNTYTFSNLTNGTYKIKAYVMDSKGIKSKIVSKEIEINIVPLNSYIISKYTGVQGENGLYYHDSTLTNGAGDNSYRYAGSDPDNYVCFGSDESTCPVDNLYRIIGVFNNQIKLIKYDYANSNLLGTDGEYSGYTYLKSSYSKYKGSLTSVDRYYWNNTEKTNSWNASLLNKTNLNINYLNNIGSKWSNMIATNNWRVGGYYSNKATSKIIFQNEMSSSIISSAKVGLVYASDYGFSVDPTIWTRALYEYSSSDITKLNWMYMGMSESTITPTTASSSSMFYIQADGDLLNDEVIYDHAIRPTFYLNNSVIKKSGDGTKTNPYRISN